MRYKDRQEQAANFQDSLLSKPDTSSAEKTQAGVSNTHAYGEMAGSGYKQIGEGVAKGIKHASDFKEGYDLAKVSQEHMANINAYFHDPAKEVQEDLDVATNTEEKMWDNLANDEAEGKGEQIVDTINIASANTAKEVARLAAAKKQGRMSNAEFVANTTRITREAIARHPTLADEILGNTKRLWEIHGVRNQMDLDKASKTAALAKQEKIEDREVTKYLETNSTAPLDPDTGLYNMPLIRAANAERERRDNQVEEAKDIANNKQIKVDRRVELLLARTGPNGSQPPKIVDTRNLLETDWFKGHSDALRAASSPEALAANPQALTLALANMEVSAQNLKGQYRTAVRDMLGNKEMEAFHNDSVARLESWVKILNTSTDNTTVKAAIASAEAQMSYSAGMNFYKKTGYTIQSAGVFAKIHSLLPEYIRQQINNGADEGGFHRIFTALASSNKMVRNNVIIENPYMGKALDNMSSASTKERNAAYVSNDLTRIKQANDASNDIINTQYNSISHMNSDAEKGARLTDVIENWGSADQTGAGKGINPETLGKANGLLKDAFTLYNNNMKGMLKKTRDAGYKVEVSYDNGEVTFSGDPVAVKSLTSIITTRVRDARKAYANMNDLPLNHPKVNEMVTKHMTSIVEETEGQFERKFDGAKDASSNQQQGSKKK